MESVRFLILRHIWSIQFTNPLQVRHLSDNYMSKMAQFAGEISWILTQIRFTWSLSRCLNQPLFSQMWVVDFYLSFHFNPQT